MLQDVTYLSSAPANLLSLGTLQQKGWRFDFINGFMSNGDHRIQMYNVGPKGKMQKVKLHAICLPLVLPEQRAPAVPRSSLAIAQEKNRFSNWHRRLAHSGVATIKGLARNGRLQIADASGWEFKMEDCDVCAVAEAT